MPLAAADVSALPLTREADSFEELYQQHAPRLYALATRMTGSQEQGEDLLQEIFLLAFRKRGSFKGEAALGTWLYRIAINHCLDFVRSRQARMARQTDSIEGDHVLQPVTRPDCATVRIDLERAIGQLPDGCRTAFVLHDVEGFDHKEVGRLLGIAEGTSKSQVFRARMKLRAMLAG